MLPFPGLWPLPKAWGCDAGGSGGSHLLLSCSAGAAGAELPLDAAINALHPFPSTCCSIPPPEQQQVNHSWVGPVWAGL